MPAGRQVGIHIATESKTSLTVLVLIRSSGASHPGRRFCQIIPACPIKASKNPTSSSTTPWQTLRYFGMPSITRISNIKVTSNAGLPAYREPDSDTIRSNVMLKAAEKHDFLTIIRIDVCKKITLQQKF
jgi:hypothetical protein